MTSLDKRCFSKVVVAASTTPFTDTEADGLVWVLQLLESMYEEVESNLAFVVFKDQERGESKDNFQVAPSFLHLYWLMVYFPISTSVTTSSTFIIPVVAKSRHLTLLLGLPFYQPR